MKPIFLLTIPPIGYRSLSAWAVGCLLIGVWCKAGDDFPKPYNSPAENHLSPMPAREAAIRMRLPKGFQAQVYASEPMVQNPIAMTWDERGRLWVAENFTYSDRNQKFDWNLRDRVIVLEDTDGDGAADVRKVFTDQVQILTSVEVGRGGVWLMCPPRLLFIPDANGDGVPDGPSQVHLEGFEIGPSSHHNFANGLKWGPDGWLYGRCGHSCPGNIGPPGTPAAQRIPMQGGIWRYHPTRKTFEVLCHGTVNPWGHDWNEQGELFFINTVIGHLWHMIPGAHFKESSGDSPNPAVFERMDMIADHYHFDTRGSWTESRAGKANDFGGGHAHSGVLIYQNHAWPETYRGKLFTLNLHGQRANQETLVRQGCGYSGKHGPDFFVAADPFFRGLDLNTGPDGQVYVLDWSDTGECHESTGVHRTSGRIFRIVGPGESKKKSPFSKPACLTGEGPILPGLWQRYQKGTLGRAELLEHLANTDEHVRVWAIRLLTDHWPLDSLLGPSPHRTPPDDPEIRNALLSLARKDPSGLVGLTLASTLQRLRLEHRAELARILMERKEWLSDRDFPFVIWYGISPVAMAQPQAFRGLLEATQEPRWIFWASRWIATHAATHPQVLEGLVKSAAAWPEGKQRAVLEGLTRGFRGWRQVKPPESWAAWSQSAFAKNNPGLFQELQLIFGEGRAFEELQQIALDTKADQPSRQKALQQLIDSRPDQTRALCEKLLEVKGLGAIAARGLARFDDPEVARRLCKQYRRLSSDDRLAVLEVLVSRKSFARVLLEEVSSKNPPVAKTDISAVHARQIRSLGDESLARKLVEVWGEWRQTPQAKLELIQQWKARLGPDQLASADPQAGRVVFENQCASCHVLFGSGKKVGPDLTGSQRGNLDYLLENILDPGATVSRDFRASLIHLKDGRLISGLVTGQTPQTLVVQTATEIQSINRSDIEEIKETNQSPMPDGLLQHLNEKQVRDLFAYLMHPHQVPLRDTDKARQP